MKSKSLENLLAYESGRHSEMVTRFQNLRDFRLLPKARGRNAEFLTPDQVVSGILSIVATRPGFAATTAIGLRNLKPVGLQEDAFAHAPTLAAALAACLEDSTLLTTVIEIRLGDSDPMSSMATSAEITYQDEEETRLTQYVPATASSLFHKGMENTFDRHSLNKQSVAQETVVLPRLLEKIAQETKEAKKIQSATERLEKHGCIVDLGIPRWPNRDAAINAPLTQEMIDDARTIIESGGE